jgi:D-proline reductase (dithiol) PrdB
MAAVPKKPSETFEDFKRSFSYGTRNDLNFKFLSALSDDDAAQFFQDLLWKLGDVFDDGDFSHIIDHVIDGQISAYSQAGRWTYDDVPFAPLAKPLAESRLALITSTGHFVDGEDPEPLGVKDMTQSEAIKRIGDFLKSEPTLTAIPLSTPRTKLRVRHGGYDIRGVQADPNVAFPVDRLRELTNEGYIGELLPKAYSFIGATSQLRLLNQAGPKWVGMLKSQEVDAALLVPV